MLWLGKSGWQGKDRINPGNEGEHLWSQPTCALSLPVKSSQAFQQQERKISPLRADKQGRWSSHSAALGIWFGASLIPYLSRCLEMWWGWEQAPKLGLSSLQLQRTTTIQSFPLALPYAHTELMEDVQFQHRDGKNNFSFCFPLTCLHHRANTPTTAQSSLIMTAVNKVLSIETSLLNTHRESGVRICFSGDRHN